MKKITKKIKKIINKFPNKLWLLIISSMFVIYSLLSGYLIYNILLLAGIETGIRTAVIICLIILIFLFLLTGINVLIKNKRFSFTIYIIVIAIFGLIQTFGAYYINKAYSSISKMNKDEVAYSTSLVSLKENNYDEIKDVKKAKIGIISDKNSVDGYVISQEIIKDNSLDKKNLVEYDNFLSILTDLYAKKIDAAFLPASYATMFSAIEGFDDIADKTNAITSKTKKMAKQNTVSTDSKKKLTEPFTALIMGVDSVNDDINSSTAFNGDALMLVTFNPKNLNATMLSIPRDTFVPIMCFRNHIKNKITHAAWYGESCMVDTIENFTGVNIDYYVKINFKGVVKLVDAVGGVKVNVPIKFCEQNSNRLKGKNLICLDKGVQKLNGEEALALSRHRHTISDIQRGQNQQLVISALLNKVKTITSVDKVYTILDLIEKNIDTNMNTSQILSFYGVAKDIISRSSMLENEDLITFQKLFLSTYGMMIYDENFKFPLSDQIYYEGSLHQVVEAMKTNLGLIKAKPIKTFSFSINDPYESSIIGKGDFSNESKIALVPDFTKHTKDYAANWGTANNVSIKFDIFETSSSQYYQDQILSQSKPVSSLVSLVNKTIGITLRIVNKTNNSTPSEPTDINCNLSENENSDACKLPNFVGQKISTADNWKSSINGNFIITKKTIVAPDASLDGVVTEQSETPGTKAKDILELEITYQKWDQNDNQQSQETPDNTEPGLDAEELVQ